VEKTHHIRNQKLDEVGNGCHKQNISELWCQLASRPVLYEEKKIKNARSTFLWIWYDCYLRHPALIHSSVESTVSGIGLVAINIFASDSLLYIIGMFELFSSMVCG